MLTVVLLTHWYWYTK